MYLEKVTSFITRNKGNNKQLLLFKHPHAGIQIPAGTIEEGENSESAALREATEETQLPEFNVICKIGSMRSNLPESKYIVTRNAKVYSRPDFNSFDWAQIRRGITVENNRRSESGFSHITYREYDDVQDPSYITYQITGWFPEQCLSKQIVRHFYHLEVKGDTPESWIAKADHHDFDFFWADINNLPKIISPQSEWVTYVLEHLNYNF